MQELTMTEVQEVSGGLIPQILLGIALLCYASEAH